MLELRGARPLLIGVVHLEATPGAPRHAGSFERVLEGCRADARALAEGGCDALIVENLGDVPYHAGPVPPETVAALALSLREARAAAGGLPVGVNVLRNDARAALGLCASAGAEFLRVNVHVGSAWTDQGLIEGRAAESLRERARLCPSALLLADVHVKHAASARGGSIVDEAADAARRGLADALILTGRATGDPPSLRELELVRERLPVVPLLAGSGVTDRNAGEIAARCDGAIVGTWLKRGGELEQPVDAERVASLRRALDARSPG